MRRLGVVLIAAAAVVVAVPSVAGAIERSDAEWLRYEVDGTGGSALSAPAGAGPPVWRRCTAIGGTCVDVAGDQYGWLTVGDVPVGTIFHVRRSDGEGAISLPYRGPFVVERAPQVSGEPRVGGAVLAVGATWGGGFGVESSFVQLQACRDAAGNGCVVLADSARWAECAATGPVLPARYRGWYLRAVDHRVSQYPALPAIAYGRPEGIPPLSVAPSPGIAFSAAVGPIAAGVDVGGGCRLPPPLEPPAPPPGEPEATPRPRPAARTVARVRVVRGRLVVARVRCARACRVVVTVRRGDRRARVATRVRGGGRWRPVALPRARARRLGPGVVRVTVRVDGTLLRRAAAVRLPRALVGP